MPGPVVVQWGKACRRATTAVIAVGTMMTRVAQGIEIVPNEKSRGEPNADAGKRRPAQGLAAIGDQIA